MQDHESSQYFQIADSTPASEDLDPAVLIGDQDPVFCSAFCESQVVVPAKDDGCNIEHLSGCIRRTVAVDTEGLVFILHEFFGKCSVFFVRESLEEESAREKIRVVVRISERRYRVFAYEESPLLLFGGDILIVQPSEASALAFVVVELGIRGIADLIACFPCSQAEVNVVISDPECFIKASQVIPD